jgi:MFS transporter, DHA1 family, multidrug resistance protein
MSAPAPNTTAMPRHIGLVVAALGGAATLAPAAMDLYMPGLPSVARELGTSTSAVALTMTAFLVGEGVGTLVSGSLSDSFGRRRPLLVGLAVYVLAAVGCAVAPGVGVLIAMRALLGLSAGGGYAIGNAVVADYARGRWAARLLSRLAMVMFLAPVLAPVIGAQMLRVTSWRGLFVAIAVLGVVVLVAAAVLVGESLPAERRTPSELSSVLRTTARLLRDRRYLGVLGASALATASFYAYLTGVSLVLQEQAGLSPTQFSIVFTINAIGMAAATMLNHRMLTRFSPGRLLGAALTISAVAAAGAVAASLVHPLNVVLLAAPLFVLVACMATMFPNATALALSLHPEVAGSASAVFGSTGMVLGALATPFVGMAGGTALAMSLVILVSAVGALAVYMVGPRRLPDVTASAPDVAQAEEPRA